MRQGRRRNRSSLLAGRGTSGLAGLAGPAGLTLVTLLRLVCSDDLAMSVFMVRGLYCWGQTDWSAGLASKWEVSADVCDQALLGNRGPSLEAVIATHAFFFIIVNRIRTRSMKAIAAYD